MRRRQYVLIVEDSPDVARLLQALIASSDTTCAVAPDCPSALALLETREPDVIVLDHMLPGETGLGVATVAAPRGIPVLVCSAYLSPEVEAQYRQVGVTEFVSKPFDIRELIRRVQQLGER